MAEIDHPNVVRLLAVYEQDPDVYLVMELMQGGELFDRIADMKFYSEDLAKETII